MCKHDRQAVFCNDCFAEVFTSLVQMKLGESLDRDKLISNTDGHMDPNVSELDKKFFKALDVAAQSPPGVLQQLAAMDEFSQHLEEDFQKRQPDYVWDVFSPEFLRQT